MNITAVAGVTRPPFLILAPICVLLGIAASAADGQPLDWVSAALALLGAVAAHMSVNALNEYGDFESGLDFRTTRTPFSGGSGTLVAHPDLAPQARLVGLFTLGTTLLVGLVLVWRSGWGLVPVGLVGMVLVYAYTDYINRNRFLCLIAPGLGFGPLMVLGTQYAVTGSYTLAAVVVALVPFFLVSNLLLLNQFPDVEPDRSVGRDNFPVTAGMGFSLRVYGLFALGAYLCVLLGIAFGVLPAATIAALIPAVGAVRVYRGVDRLLARGEPSAADLTPCLAVNVALTLATPTLLALGLLLGG